MGELAASNSVSWDEAVPKGTPLREVQSRISEGVVHEVWEGVEVYRQQYGNTNLPEFHPYYKGLYAANAERVDVAVERAVEDYRVNAFFILLGHLNSVER